MDIKEIIGIEEWELTMYDIIFGIVVGLLYIGLISFSIIFAFAQPSLPQATTGIKWVTILLLAPVFEEGLFRGVLLNLLRLKELALPWIILISSLAFAFFHWFVYLGGASFSQVQGVFLGAFIFGVIAGLIACYRHNIVASMIPHAIINGYIFFSGLSIVGVSII